MGTVEFIKQSKSYLSFHKIGLVSGTDNLNTYGNVSNSFTELNEFMKKYPRYVMVLHHYAKGAYKYRTLKYHLNDMKMSFKSKYFSKPLRLELPALPRHIPHDSDFIMFHAAFQTLVNFVEIELVHDIMPENLPEGFKKVKLKHKRRYPELAIALAWDYPNKDVVDSKYEKSRRMALQLYLWYTTIYMPRLQLFNETIDEEVTNKILTELGYDVNNIDTMPNVPNPDSQLWTVIRNEEQSMLSTLISVRSDLWV